MADSVTAAPKRIDGDHTIPEWIELVPSGATVQGRDGRFWYNTNPAAVVAALDARGKPLVIDWEHGSELLAANGHRSAAAGWVVALQLRGGAVWGKVEWTPQGATDVRERGYRYVSPVFIFDGKSREIRRIKSVALTNEPNLELEALNMTQDEDRVLPKIARALSLDHDADEAAILLAIEKLRNGVQQEEQAANRSVNAETHVPRRDYELAMARLRGLEEREAERRDAEIEKTVDEVISVGDPAFPPAQRETFLAMCREEGGLDRFREIARPDARRSLSRSALPPSPAQLQTTRMFTGEERSILNTLGVDPEKIK